MKDFIEKPITAEVRALVHEIVDRFLDYNPTVTQQEDTGSKPTFFLYFSGHIGTLEAGLDNEFQEWKKNKEEKSDE